MGGTVNDNYIIAALPQPVEAKLLLLSELASGTKVYVKDITGKFKYRVLAEVADSDTLILKRNGKVVHMTGKPGRKTSSSLSALSSLPPDPTPTPAAPSVPVKSGKVSLSDVDKFISYDPLVRAARANSDSQEVLSETIIRLTEIASTLAKERVEASRNGESVSLSARREVSALIAVRDASLKRIDQRLRKQEIDLDGLPFKNLYVFLIRTFANAMDTVGMPSTEIDSVLSQVGKEVDTPEWKQMALKELQGGFR